MRNVSAALHKRMHDPRIDSLARQLVRYSTKIKKGDRVMLDMFDAPNSMTVALIREEPDEAVWAIVKNWPTRFEARRARELGFKAEESFDEIVRAHIEDEIK